MAMLTEAECPECTSHAYCTVCYNRRGGIAVLPLHSVRTPFMEHPGSRSLQIECIEETDIINDFVHHSMGEIMKEEIRKEKGKNKVKTSGRGTDTKNVSMKTVSGKTIKKAAGGPEKPGKNASSKPSPGTKAGERAENRKDSPKKKRSRCGVSGLCGGCSMINMPYDEQIRGKQKVLDDLIGEFVIPDKFIRMKAPDHYRFKVTSVFAPDKKGKPACGIYREGTHEVIPVKSCLIENIQADRIIQTIFSLLPSFRIHVYDEDMDIGLLRYVQVRVARATKEIMVTLVMTDTVLPSRNTFVRELTKRHPEITTIIINVNDRNTTMVLGNRETVIYGKGYIEDVLCGKRFRISSRSFYQVNPLMTEKLYNIAIDAAALTGKETVLDTYCGIGTIGIIAAPHARRVVGIELNADAVRDAQQNIKMNGLDNIEILQGDATEFMIEMAQNGTKADVIFMDPPRSGSTEEFMRAACDISPKKIVYISCSPWSLQRDLEFFTENGYEARMAIPVDMFPYTSGIETVVLLTHIK